MKKKLLIMLMLFYTLFMFNISYVLAVNDKVSCGSIGSFNKKIPELTSWIFLIIQVIVPVILVILGVIDFVKALTSQKDDEIKKGQKIFIKRLITGILIFFVVAIVKLVVSMLDNNSNNILNCVDCFISNKCN